LCSHQIVEKDGRCQFSLIDICEMILIKLIKIHFLCIYLNLYLYLML